MSMLSIASDAVLDSDSRIIESSIDLIALAFLVQAIIRVLSNPHIGPSEAASV